MLHNEINMILPKMFSHVYKFNQNKSNVCIQITLNSESHFSQFNLLLFGSHLIGFYTVFSLRQ